jgi:thiol-disulfide isomerase/thioredoxin
MTRTFIEHEVPRGTRLRRNLPQKQRLFGVVSLFLFALFLFACTAKTEPQQAQSDAAQNSVLATQSAFESAGLNAQRIRRELPEFTAPLLADKKQVNLSDYRGKVVLVNLWATWCGPCRAEMPSMEILYQRFKERGLEILAVNIEEDAETVASFMDQLHLSFPALLDLDGKIAGSYGIQAIPASYLLDRQGKVVVHLVGSIDWNNDKLFEAFEALLAE